MIKKKLVFWDWEETLVSKNLYANFLLKQIGAKYGYGEVDINSPINKFSASQIAEVKVAMLKNTWFVPYAWSLVKAFNALGIKQAIVSNASSSTLKRNIDIAPFKDFDFVCGSDMFKPKPNLEMFAHVINALNVSYDDAIFIGDSESDLLCAKKANMDFFKIDGSAHSYYQIFEFFNL